jgi:hypothetical protein
LGIFLFFDLQLLPEGLEFAVVGEDGAADEVVLLSKLGLELVDDVVELVDLLLQVGAVLPQLARLVLHLALQLQDARFLVLHHPVQLLQLAVQPLLPVLH